MLYIRAYTICCWGCADFFLRPYKMIAHYVVLCYDITKFDICGGAREMREVINNVSSVIVGISLLGACVSLLLILSNAIRKKETKPFVISFLSCFALLVVFTIIGSAAWAGTDEGKESVEQAKIEREQRAEEKKKQEEEQQKQAEQERIEKEKQESEVAEQKRIAEEEKRIRQESEIAEQDKINKEEKARRESVEAEKAEKEKPQAVFVTDLLNSWSEYVGKKVTVSYACGRCEDKEQGIESKYDYEAQLYLKSYVDNYRQFAYDDYITVTGTVSGKNGMYIEIKDAHIDYFGNDSKAVYEQGKTEYDERKRIEKEEYEARFKESAETPSYDNLMRYPDTYTEKQIKVKVKIVRIEPDGIIFDGDIEATMQGESVALYDGRENKEPKLREGDLATIYGYGKGLTTVKVQDVSGWVPKTVDKYDIPSIDIRYIEFD